MKRLAFLTLLFLSPAANAGEIAPRTVTNDASSYTVVMHVSAVEDATAKFQGALADAKAKIGSISSSQNMAMPRPGGGFDVTYKFLK